MFFESSAKVGDTARNLFIKAAQVLYKDSLKYADSQPETPEGGETMKLPQAAIKDDITTNKGCC